MTAAPLLSGSSHRQVLSMAFFTILFNKHNTRQPHQPRRRTRGDRGAIAASLIEIGVAMLAVGILSAGAVTTFAGFLNNTSDFTAANRLDDAVIDVRNDYNNALKAGGQHCFGDVTRCQDLKLNTNQAIQDANKNYADRLKANSGNEINYLGFNPAAPVKPENDQIMIDIGTNPMLIPGNAAKKGELTETRTTGTAGNPADLNYNQTYKDNPNSFAGKDTAKDAAAHVPGGKWIRLMTASESGSTMCVILIGDRGLDELSLRGAKGYMSVNADISKDNGDWAHCGALKPTLGAGADSDKNSTKAICVWRGSSSTATGVKMMDAEKGEKVQAASSECATSSNRTGAGNPWG